MHEMDLTHAHWRKSSYSSANGQCVEVAHVRAQWRKSSHSGANACIEVAHLPEAIAVRDSKDPAGPKLIFNRRAWAAFVESAKHQRLPTS
jgi:uncharacterized protein DUF397